MVTMIGSRRICKAGIVHWREGRIRKKWITRNLKNLQNMTLNDRNNILI
jgi:hypothetical protein